MSKQTTYFEPNAFDTYPEALVQQQPLITTIDSMPLDLRAQLMKWRMRPAWLLPQSWQEAAVFVGFALAIKYAYNVFYSEPDTAPGEFPIDRINPLKRHVGENCDYDATLSAGENEEREREAQEVRRQVVGRMMEGDEGNVISTDYPYQTA